MVCKMCSTGADMQHRADELQKEGLGPFDKIRQLGIKLHNYCKGSGHCDCQHKPVGKGNIDGA